MTDCNKCGKSEDRERKDTIIKAVVDIKRFLLFHKERIRLLKKLLKEEDDDRLIFQISILGLESLARVLSPNEKDSKVRFIKLVSKEMKRKEVIRLYTFYRCPLVHEGFLNPFSISEIWNGKEVGFIYTFEKYLDADIIGSSDYPPETLLIIYEELLYYVESFFKKRNIKSRILKRIKVYGLPKEAKRIKRKLRK